MLGASRTREARINRETLEVPAAVRRQVIERDGSCCRVCGRYVSAPAVHHIEYRSEGGLHVLENLVTVGWLPGHDCHLGVVHANKRVWQPILKRVVQAPGSTALAVRRADVHAGNVRYLRSR